MKIVYRSPWWNGTGGYRACTVIYKNGSRKTLMEHREVTERAIGRKLKSDEFVHHKDGNKANNDLGNLEIQGRAEHSRFHARDRYVAPIKLKCLECEKNFTRIARYERYNRKRGKHGPFCGKSCSAKWFRKNRPWSTSSNGGKYVHGTDTAYGYHGCRCSVCTEAHRIRIKEWRKKGQVGK